jgi:hypothetical protein
MADVINVSINNSGVPSGGSTGQLLRKKSGLSYDLEWVNAGASTAQTLSLGGAGNRELSISGGNTVTLPVSSNSVITNFSLSGNILTLELDNASPVTVDLTAIGITVAQSNAIVANTAKVGITTQQANDITANNSKVGITAGQASAIIANTSKVGITPQQTSDITANNSKVGITVGQASAIIANSAKVGIPTGGTANQVLSKTSATDYATSWVTPSAGSGDIAFAVSDETTALTTGLKLTFRMPYAMTLTGVRSSLTTASVGSPVIADINVNGTSILSTKLSIDATERTSVTASTAPVITNTALISDDEITIDIDQVGSSTAGAGLKIYLLGFKN